MIYCLTPNVARSRRLLRRGNTDETREGFLVGYGPSAIYKYKSMKLEPRQEVRGKMSDSAWTSFARKGPGRCMPQPDYHCSACGSGRVPCVGVHHGS